MTLPRGWTRGLSLPQIRRIREIERRFSPPYFPPLLSWVHPKGYRAVMLCRHHPYAGRAGWAYLHRYVLQRHLGRRLATWEHAHHRDGASLETWDVSDLELRDEIDHGRYHYGKRIGCGLEFTPAEIAKMAAAGRLDEGAVLRIAGDRA